MNPLDPPLLTRTKCIVDTVEECGQNGPAADTRVRVGVIL